MSTSPAPATPGTIAHHIGAYCFVNSLSHDDLAKQLGMDNGNVIRMVATGAMRPPLSLVTPLADLLEVDKFDLLDGWLQEHHADLQAMFRELRARSDITPAEQRMVAYCRQLAGQRAAAPILIEGRSVVALLV